MSQLDPRDEMIITCEHSREKPFTCITNSACSGKLLNSTFGLLTRIIGLPKNWKINPIDLARRMNESAYAIYRDIRELIKHGYMIRAQETVFDEDGRCKRGKIQYFVFEEPLPLEKRVAHVEKILHKPYFPDISKPKKIRKSASVDMHAPHAEAKLALGQNLLNNKDKRNKEKDKDIIEESLPLQPELKNTKTLPQEKTLHAVKTTIKPTDQHTSRRESRQISIGRFKLSNEQAEAFEWLKSQRINTDELTLSWWARNYSFSRLRDVVLFAKERQERGQKISNIGGWIHRLLKQGAVVVNQSTRDNLEFAQLFAAQHAWSDLEFREKYVFETSTQSELPLTMQPEEFVPAFIRLFEKKHRYQGITV